MRNCSKQKITIKQAKNGEYVPSVDGISLHSLNNPRKEAEAFANNYLAQLYENPNILCLGLGMGYHLEEFRRNSLLKNKNVSLKVIEPNPQMVRLYRSYASPIKELEILTPSTSIDLFFDNKFVDFIITKPVTIIHPQSYKLNRDFFSQFLNYRPRKEIKDYRVEGNPVEIMRAARLVEGLCL